MDTTSCLDFDIDVDLSGLLGDVAEPVLVDGRWYELALARPGRSRELHERIEQGLHNALLLAQWRAARQRDEKRQAVRVPLASRVFVNPGAPMVACDLSLSGLRCSGRPRSGMLDIEFSLPGLAFPVDARAEVVSFKNSAVLPLTGLRFVDIDRPYLEHIATYIARKRREKRAGPAVMQHLWDPSTAYETHAAEWRGS